MSISSSVEREICKAIKMKAPGPGADQDTLRAIATKVQELADASDKSDDKTDDFWGSLSEPAQDWANRAQTAMNDDQAIPAFPPDAGAGAANGTGNQEQKMSTSKKAAKSAAKSTDKKPKPGQTAAPSGKKAAAKAEPPVDGKKKAAAKPDKAPKPAGKVTGVKVQIKSLILKKPTITAEEIVTALSKNGDTVSKYTVSSIRSEFRHSLRVLNQEGITSIEL